MIWRREESISTGRNGRTKSWHMKKEREPVVPAGDIANWEDRFGIVLRPGAAVPIKIPIVALEDRAPAIVERPIPPMAKRPLDAEQGGEPEEPQAPAPKPLGKPKPKATPNGDVIA